MAPAERAEVDALAADLPCLDVGVAVGVLDGDSDDPKADGLDFVAEGDIVTLLVTLSYTNILSRPGCGPTTRVPPVFAPHCPVPKAEEWHLFLTTETNSKLVQYKVLASTPDKPLTAVVTEKLQFLAPPRAGKVMYRLHVRSSCYAGLDQVLDVAFDVKPKSEVPAWVEHAEDRELDEGKDQALESMMGGGGVDDDSDDEDGGGDADGDAATGSGARATSSSASAAAAPAAAAAAPGGGASNPLVKRRAAPGAVAASTTAAAPGAVAANGGNGDDDDDMPSLLRGAKAGGKKAPGAASATGQLLAKAKVAAAGDSDDD